MTGATVESTALLTISRVRNYVIVCTKFNKVESKSFFFFFFFFFFVYANNDLLC